MALPGVWYSPVILQFFCTIQPPGVKRYRSKAGAEAIDTHMPDEALRVCWAVVRHCAARAVAVMHSWLLPIPR